MRKRTRPQAGRSLSLWVQGSEEGEEGLVNQEEEVWKEWTPPFRYEVSSMGQVRVLYPNGGSRLKATRIAGRGYPSFSIFVLVHRAVAAAFRAKYAASGGRRGILSELGREYGVSHVNITAIVKRTTWRHVS